MKLNLLLLSSAMLLLNIANGQNAGPEEKTEKSFYYYGEEKIPLYETVGYIFYQVIEPAAGNALKTELKRKFQIQENELRLVEGNSKIIIDLKKSGEQDQQSSIMQWMDGQGKQFIARPSVKIKGGKDIIWDDGFYVKLKSGTSFASLQSLAATHQCIIEKPYHNDPRVFLLKATAASNYDGLAMANTFFETGLFAYSEPDFRGINLHHAPPNDTHYPLQWALKNTGSNNPAAIAGTAGVDIKAEEAWEITKGNATIKIAIIDEGVDTSHPDLKPNLIPGFNSVLNSTESEGHIVGPTRSHGTNCAGIAASAGDNSIGVSGVAPNCKILPVAIVQSTGVFGTSAQIALGIDWAWETGGADILSNSWGGGGYSSLIHDAVKRAVTLGRAGKGCIVVFSSGNSDQFLANPASFDEVIAVGATNMCGERKSISSCDNENFWGGNYGQGLDISAPGVKIYSTTNAGVYNTSFNGTSASTPFVSGVAALVLSINPNLTQQQVRDILEQSATKLPGYTYTNNVLQPNGTWNNEVGHGMVNALAAVQKAQSGSFCKVAIGEPGSSQICAGTTAAITVLNPVQGATYQWRRNNTNLSVGTSINANQAGTYDVIGNFTGGCQAQSGPVVITIAQNTGTLTANAGNDTSLCIGSKILIGGAPVATGGFPFINRQRAYGFNFIDLSFTRFNPQRPGTEFTIIKTSYFDRPTTDIFPSGGAFTPTGFYQILRSTNQLIRVDTLTGNIEIVGSCLPPSGFTWNAMGYDKVGKVLYGIASTGSNSQLVPINIKTGATILPAISVASANILAIAFDNSGQLFGFSISTDNIFKINKTTGAITNLPAANIGLSANFAQDGAIDPTNDSLYLSSYTQQLNNANAGFHGGWLLANKTTGTTTAVGPIALPRNEFDGVSIAGPTYKYQWSPATNLSNPNDANPWYTGTTAGQFNYTVTITDQCGNTTSDQVTITVNSLPQKPVIIASDPNLSANNNFTVILQYDNPLANHSHKWLQNTFELPEPSNNLTIIKPASQTTSIFVQVTNNTTGCVNLSNVYEVVYAPGVLMNNNNALTYCDTSFYDAGGPGGSTGSTFTRTFTPATPGSKMKLRIHKLELAPNASLGIFDGNSASSPRIEVLSNTANSNVIQEYTASNPEGQLTIRYSIGSFTSSGWLAGLHCYQPRIFRTIADGNYTQASIWESKLPGGQYQPASSAPSKGDDSIYIRHHVAITGSVKTDQVVIETSGVLTTSADASVGTSKMVPQPEFLVRGSLVNGAGKQFFGSGVMVVTGSLSNAGAINLDSVNMRGTALQTLTGGANAEISVLDIDNPLGVTLVGNTRIQNKLKLTRGLVNSTAGNLLLLRQGSATDGGSNTSHINGPVQAQSGSEYRFPIGKNGIYRPVIVNGDWNSESGPLLQAEVIMGAPTERNLPAGISRVSTIRHYKVGVVSGLNGTPSATITLPYGSDDGVTDAANLKVAKDNGAGAWVDLAGTASGAAPGTIQSIEFSSFSDFVLANNTGGNNPLPLNWLSFTGSKNQMGALLNWSTANEVNTLHFEVERSSNGIQYVNIGQVAAAIQPAIKNDYAFVDNQPASGVNYYRLKQVDKDGTASYSSVVILNFTASGALVIYPNPANQVLNISNLAGTATIRLFDMTGKLVMQKNSTGFQTSLATHLLPSGIYEVSILQKGEVISQKVWIRH